MKFHSSNKYLIFFLLFIVFYHGYGQKKKDFEGNRWRAGFSFLYSTSFKNINIPYASGSAGVLGGYTGRGINIFGGYKPHKYISLELEAGILINNFNQRYSSGEVFIGRFNKFSIQPKIKFIYPIIKRDNFIINAFVGGGIGLNGSGRFYLEDRYGIYRNVLFARYNPMLAPFMVLGVEVLRSNQSGILIGFKYQNGSYTANKYYESFNPYASLKTASPEIKNINAQGLGLFLGIIQEF